MLQYQEHFLHSPFISSVSSLSSSGIFPSLTTHQLCIFFILIRNIPFTHHSSALYLLHPHQEYSLHSTFISSVSSSSSPGIFSSLTIHQLCIFFVLIRNILFTHHSSVLYLLHPHQEYSLHSPFISFVSSLSSSGIFSSLTIHQFCIFFILIRNILFTHHSSALFSSLTIHQLCIFFILTRNIPFTHHSSALYLLHPHQEYSLHSTFISSVSSSSSSGIFS